MKQNSHQMSKSVRFVAGPVELTSDCTPNSRSITRACNWSNQDKLDCTRKRGERIFGKVVIMLSYLAMAVTEPADAAGMNVAGQN